MFLYFLLLKSCARLRGALKSLLFRDTAAFMSAGISVPFASCAAGTLCMKTGATFLQSLSFLQQLLLSAFPTHPKRGPFAAGDIWRRV